MSHKPRINSPKIEYVTIESTQDLIEALQKIFSKNKIDIVIHSAAVGDYAGKYSIRTLVSSSLIMPITFGVRLYIVIRCGS